MRLVAKDPVFYTIQGEGFYCGRPSVFVRLWGCDYSCEWCDTKDSWKPGSAWLDMDVLGLLREVSLTLDSAEAHPHVVITGGNPLLQASELGVLLRSLAVGYPRSRVTVETQGTFDGQKLEHVELVMTALSKYGGLLSVSPKFHQWPDLRWIKKFHCDKQFKLVVTDEVTEEEVCRRVTELRTMPGPTGIVLQPLYQLGSTGVERCVRLAKQFGDVAVIPQLHKKVLRVP